MTFIYCQPAAIDNVSASLAVDFALATLALELGLDTETPLREVDSTSVTIHGVTPHETWAAMDRVLGRSHQRYLFHCPEL